MLKTGSAINTTVAGIRGATTLSDNSHREVLDCTTELINELITANELRPQTVAAVIFTTTPDIDAEFPALAVRAIEGWQDVPLLGAVEMNKSDATPLCIRALILANRQHDAPAPVFKYLRGASALRN